MKDDYLWDKSGEPDPEIRELEEILGTLRYQPRALEIPADLEVGGKRNSFRRFTPPMAIAAAIALLLFGTALWFGLQQMKANSQPQVARKPAVNPEAPAAASPERKQLAVNPDSKEAVAAKGADDTQQFVAVPRHKTRKAPRNSASENSQFAANRKEAEAAKDQLFLALRVASMKLSFAQKKTQSPNPKDLIHNQHRIG